MRKITVEYNIYKYSELEENIKNKVKEKIESMIVENNFYSLKEDLEYILNDVYNLTDFELNYSFTFCQGDGCCFYNIVLLSYENLKNNKDLNAFEKYITENYTPEEIEMIIKYLQEDNLYLKKYNHHYDHKYTCSIDFGYYTAFYEEEKNSKEIDEINELIEKVTKDLEKNVYYKICDHLEAEGYKRYNVSENEIIEFIELNNYEFYENGGIY